MKLYESTLRDTIVLVSDAAEISCLDIKWSYVISMSIWLPLLLILIVLLTQSTFISKSWRYFTEARGNVLKSSERSNQTEEMNKSFLVEKNFSSEQRQITNFLPNIETVDTVETISTEQMRELQTEIDKMREFSEAFKYLCTCLPGNKILARKPIRMTFD